MKKILLIMVVALCSVSLLSAKEYPNNEAKVTVSIPDNWDVEVSEGILEAGSPSEAVGLVFFVLDADNLDEAIDALDEELSSIVDNIEEDGEPEEIEHNGMEGIYAEAMGTIEGESVGLLLMVLETPSDKVIMILGIGAEDEVTEDDEEALDEIFDSLRPL